LEARTSTPVDDSLESSPPVAVNVHPSMDKVRTRVKLIPAPPETTLKMPVAFTPLISVFTTAPCILQFTNVDFFVTTCDALDTATAPPRTATLGIPAPRAVQLIKLQEKTPTTNELEPGTSTAKAPPAL
jgi:hypothetical protein